MSFDDCVTIKNNSSIYTNAYDATYNSNSYNPYYAGKYNRDVQGIVYELNGSIYVVYETDYNAEERKNQLESQGAVITAVLVSREDVMVAGQYEGYYNVNSVKVKVKK